MSRVALLLAILLLLAGCQKPPEEKAAKADPPKQADPDPEPPKPPKKEPEKSKEKPKEKVVTPRPNPFASLPNLGVVSLRQLEGDYLKDRVLADMIYKGKAMTVTMIANQTKLDDDVVFAAMSTVVKPNGMIDTPNYYFYFPIEDVEIVRKMKIGATYTIEGKCLGYHKDDFDRGGRGIYKWHVRFDLCRLVGG